MKKEKSDVMYVVRSSKVHGSGIFARKNIPKGTQIIEYVGEVISRREGTKRAEKQSKLSKKNGGGAVYIFELNNGKDLDGNFQHNTARLINHSCEPNCKYRMRGKRIWIVSKRTIKRGEELTYDYGFDIDDYKNNVAQKNVLVISLEKITSKNLKR